MTHQRQIIRNTVFGLQSRLEPSGAAVMSSSGKAALGVLILGCFLAEPLPSSCKMLTMWEKRFKTDLKSFEAPALAADNKAAKYMRHPADWCTWLPVKCGWSFGQTCTESSLHSKISRNTKQLVFGQGCGMFVCKSRVTKMHFTVKD